MNNPKDDSASPFLLKPRDAAKQLQICERSRWALTKRGEIRSVRIGASVRYTVNELRNYVARKLRQDDRE